MLGILHHAYSHRARSSHRPPPARDGRPSRRHPCFFLEERHSRSMKVVIGGSLKEKSSKSCLTECVCTMSTARDSCSIRRRYMRKVPYGGTHCRSIHGTVLEHRECMRMIVSYPDRTHCNSIRCNFIIIHTYHPIRGVKTLSARAEIESPPETRNSLQIWEFIISQPFRKHEWEFRSAVIFAPYRDLGRLVFCCSWGSGTEFHMENG